ncbi:MAG: hypothetical protein WCB69_04105, partial [Pseudolabrys sp.]
LSVTKGPHMGMRERQDVPRFRPQPAPQPHVTYKLVCWGCRRSFEAKRIDAAYCSIACNQRGYRHEK